MLQGTAESGHRRRPDLRLSALQRLRDTGRVGALRQPPRRSSASPNVRPAIADIPSASKKRPLAQMASRNAVSPALETLTLSDVQANASPIKRRSRISFHAL